MGLGRKNGLQSRFFGKERSGGEGLEGESPAAFRDNVIIVCHLCCTIPIAEP